MQINIQARNFTLTNAIHGHVTRRLGFAFQILMVRARR